MKLKTLTVASLFFIGSTSATTQTSKQKYLDVESLALEHIELIQSLNQNSNKEMLSFATVGADNCDFDNIQDAINSGVDEVRIASNKNYNENIYLNDISISLRGGYSSCADANNDIQNSDKATIIGVANASEPVIAITGHDQRHNVVLEQLNLTGGTGTNFLSGGGISTLDADALISLDQVNIYNNHSSYGGGIAAQGNSPNTDTDFILRDTLIYQNSATDGGGIYCSGIESSILMYGNSGINSNTADDDENVPGSGNGGGLYITTDCSFALYSGTQNSDTVNDLRGIAFNTATNRGGGVHANKGSFVNLIGYQFCINNVCIGSNSEPLNINDNIAGSKGGGISALDDSTKILLHSGLVENNDLLNVSSSGAGIAVQSGAFLETGRLSKACWNTEKCNLFRNNRAKTEGGAISIVASTAEIYSSYFEGNRADNGTAINTAMSDTMVVGSVFAHNGNNGGAYADNAVFSAGGIFDGTIDVINNTFVDNNTTQSVFDVTHSNSSVMNIKNSIIQESNANIKVINSDLPDTGTAISCLMVHETGSLNNQSIFNFGEVNVDDPMFVNRIEGDYHLDAAVSPAIDRCINEGVTHKDIDAESFGWDDPFVINKNNSPNYRSDIGADETRGNDIIFYDGFQQ